MFGKVNLLTAAADGAGKPLKPLGGFILSLSPVDKQLADGLDFVNQNTNGENNSYSK